MLSQPRFHRFVGLLLLISLLAGCAGGQAPSASTLRFAFPDTPAARAAAEALQKGYASVTPGITLELQPLDAKTYGSSLSEALKSANPPDLFTSIDSDVPRLEQDGALLDLAPHGVKPGNQPPALIQPWQAGEKLFGLPQNAIPQMLFYNRALFDAAGQSYPTNGWTWDEWREAAKRLTNKAQGTYGTSVGSWDSIIWNNNGNVLNPDGTKAMLDQPEAFQAIQFVADMINVDGSAPLPPVAGGPDPSKLFREGNLAMLPAPSSLMASLQEQQPSFTWDIAPLPTHTQRTTSLSVTALAANAKTKSPDAAASFIGWAGSAAGIQTTTSAFPYAVPALSDVSPSELLSKSPSGSLVVDALRYGRVPTFVVQTPEINKAVNEALVPVWQGQASAESAYRAVTPKINAILQQG